MRIVAIAVVFFCVFVRRQNDSSIVVADTLFRKQADYVSSKIEGAESVLIIHRGWDDCTLRFGMGGGVEQFNYLPAAYFRRAKGAPVGVTAFVLQRRPFLTIWVWAG